jgi:hypothetical protein
VLLKKIRITPPILLRLNISEKAKEEDFTQYGSSAKSIFLEDL